ncbi:MAG: folate-binding protein [Propionibacteriaceae bacterium]|jgi:folate-binding protein YgfZ|nr:folate-binding protein [Propionibacteriaceae bacterium]
MVLVVAGIDQGLLWHDGNPLLEQRHLDSGAMVNLSNRQVFSIHGRDALRLVSLLGSADLSILEQGVAAASLLLDASGHIRCWLALCPLVPPVDGDAPVLWGWTSTAAGADLVEHLNARRFRLEATARLQPEVGVVWQGPGAPKEVVGLDQAELVADRHGAWDCLGGRQWLVRHPEALMGATTASIAGTWAYEARRIAAGVPRIGVDTDDETIANELGAPTDWLSLSRGCYPGQEVVSRIHNLGSPPRRLVQLHFDGQDERLPEVGQTLIDPDDGWIIGRMGSSAYHGMLGPIGLGLINRNHDDAREVQADGLIAKVVPLVDKDAGRHFQAPKGLARPARL